jgi:glycosyltransferase involved in cell wall biosynthesis
MIYDLIIVTQSSQALIEMTQACIDSAHQCNVNVIIVETGQPYKYRNVDRFIEYNGEFNYNRALNFGLKKAIGDVHILANNDLIFHPGWDEIGDLMKWNEFHSACVLSQDPRQKEFQRGNFVYEGYEVGKHITGWCIFMDNYCHDKIGKLDEYVSFWYSDNLYALQLQASGIRHGLFCNYKVDHLESQTLKRQTSKIKREFQLGELSKYQERLKYYAERESMLKVNTENL